MCLLGLYGQVGGEGECSERQVGKTVDLDTASEQTVAA